MRDESVASMAFEFLTWSARYLIEQGMNFLHTCLVVHQIQVHDPSLYSNTVDGYSALNTFDNSIKGVLYFPSALSIDHRVPSISSCINLFILWTMEQIRTLPIELFETILQYFDAPTLCHIAFVSRSWHAVRDPRSFALFLLFSAAGKH